MNAWDLVLQHRYEEALVTYDSVVRLTPNDYLAQANRATDLLCMGRIEDALRGFIVVDDLLGKHFGGKSGAYSESIASIQWTMGNRREAMAKLRQTAESIRAGRIEFTDAAGGVGCGLLLWFMGIVGEDSDTVAYSRDYLELLSQSTKIKSWPGPIGMYVLGKATLGSVLRKAGGTEDISEIAERANSDLLTRRQYCQILFYLATQKYSEGDVAGYLQGMTHCSQLENPIIEHEWYLASAEAAKAK